MPFRADIHQVLSDLEASAHVTCQRLSEMTANWDNNVSGLKARIRENSRGRGDGTISSGSEGRSNVTPCVLCCILI